MKDNRIRWLAAAVIILAFGIVIFGVIVSQKRSGNDSVDISLPDPSSASSLSEGSIWPDEGTSDMSVVELTIGNVRTVIELMKRPKVYYSNVVTTVYYGERQRRISAEQWLLDTKAVTCKHDESFNTKTYIIRADGMVKMWREGDSEAYTCAEGQFGDDDIMGIPTYETLLESDAQIITAEYRKYGDDLCIYVKTGTFSTYDDYYIGVDSGLLLHSESYAGNELTYSMSLTKWSEDVSGAESIIPPA